MAREALQPTPESQLHLMRTAAERYSGQMMEAADWLAGRGIELGTAAKFQLGVVNDPIPGHEWYAGKLAIPYLNASGQVMTIRFRCLQEHSCKEAGHAKYLTLHGDTVRLFNPQAFTSPDTDLHVAEGEFDCMILTQMGLNAIAAPGVATWADRHTVMCSGFSNVYLWGDGDDAGRQFNQALSDKLDTARVVHLPSGHDITSLHQEGGSDAVASLLNSTKELYR